MIMTNDAITYTRLTREDARDLMNRLTNAGIIAMMMPAHDGTFRVVTF